MPSSERIPVYFWIGLAVMGAAGGLWFFVPAGKLSKANSPVAVGGQAPGRAVRVVAVKPVIEKLQRVSDSSPAEVLPFEQTDLHAKVAGYLQKIHVDIGDVVHPLAKDDKDLDKDLDRLVKERKVLAEIWVPEMKAERAQKQAEVEQAAKGFEVAQAQVATAAAQVKEAVAGVARAEANHQRWKLEYDRIWKLVSSKGIDEQTALETWNQLQSAAAAQKEGEAKVDSAKALLKESEAKQAKAKADESTAGANLQYVETMLTYTKVVAPFDGVVTKLNLHTGAFLNPKGMEQPIFTITRTDKLRIILDIPEKDAGYLNTDKTRPNNLARVKFDALPDLPGKDKPFVWPITKFAPVLGGGKKVRVEIHIDNPGGRLFPGMYGRATVLLEEKPALTVPAACLGTDSKGTFVWKAVDGKAKRQNITTGLNDGKKVEVTSGLTGQDEIIGTGKDVIREGQPVQVRPGEM